MQTSESIKPGAPKSGGSTVLIPLGRVRDYRPAHDTARFFCDNGSLAVSAAGAQALRLSVGSNAEASLPRPTLAVCDQSTGSISLQVDGEDALVSSQHAQITVHMRDASLDVSSPAAGELTLWRAPGGKSVVRLRKLADGHYYGLGETTGTLDKNGEAYTMWNSDVYAPHVPEMESLYVSIPFLIEFQGGIARGWFLDNPGKSRFDLRSHADFIEITTETGGVDLYLLPGPTMKDVIGQYTELTGRIPMPPAWALGYHQSRYSYMDESEVRQLVDTFREKQIPLDAVYLDIHHMDGYRVFTFDSQRFSDPGALVADLRHAGVHLVPIVDPGIKQDPCFPAYRDGVSESVFCKSIEGNLFIGEVWPGPSAFPDFSEDRVRSWWAKQQQFYVDLGIDGIWNDMNEPAVFNDTKTMESYIVHSNNGQPKTHGELHNLYGLWMADATYNGLLQSLSGSRPFLVTRSGFAGVQRYGAVWTGDNRSFWEHMAMAIPMVLNMGLAGIALAGPDVGGFAHHASAQLLARWTEMGAFFPFFRNHSAEGTVRQEPWAFGPVIEDIVRRYIRLRYRLMPYLYSVVREAAVTGLPIMRPLVLEYPDDRNTYNLADEFLVGRDLLVAPVLQPDATCRAVYLPQGVWVDYWTGERRPGGQHVLANAPLDTLPLFVRAGAIIPEGPERMSAAETKPGDPLVIHVYESGERGTERFILYEDDGHSTEYASGAYNEVEVIAEKTSQALAITFRDRHRGYTDKMRSATIRVHRASGEIADLVVADVREPTTVRLPLTPPAKE